MLLKVLIPKEFIILYTAIPKILILQTVFRNQGNYI